MWGKTSIFSSLPISLLSAAGRGADSQAEDALGVGVEHLFQDGVRVAQLAPLAEQPLVGKARVVAAEHDLVLQPATNIALERLGEVLRRPARQLPVHVALV